MYHNIIVNKIILFDTVDGYLVKQTIYEGSGYYESPGDVVTRAMDQGRDPEL